MNVSAMNTTAYAVPQNAAKLPQTAERVQGAQAVDAAKAPAAKEAGAAFDVKISDAAREKAAEKVAADQDAPAKNGKAKGLTADEVKALQDDIDNSYNILIKTMTEQNAKLQAWQADGTGFLNFDGRKVLTAQFALPDVATTPEDAKKAIADGGDWSVNAVADRIMNIATSIAGDDPKKLETLRSAVQAGFKQAGIDFTEMTGKKDMPEITGKTYDEVMSRFDKLVKKDAAGTDAPAKDAAAKGAAGTDTAAKDAAAKDVPAKDAAAKNAAATVQNAEKKAAGAQL